MRIFFGLSMLLGIGIFWLLVGTVVNKLMNITFGD